MATFLQGESRRMYSWWWDSHISPKNSKWLQENLTDMDRNIKAMIKLIEEDADSFARRAEMYYKKRPELMKMVEEFYRAYRALAERYNHATGALRQAHRTMTEAFPNQIPPILPDDSPAVEIGPHTPEMPSPMRALEDVDDLQEDALGLSSHFHARRKSGAYNEDNILLSSKKGLKQLKEMFPPGEGKVRKVLNFKEEQGIVAEKEDLNNEIKRLQEQVAKLSTTNRNLSSLMESESQCAHALEETIFKLESTKEVSLLRHKHSIERISTLETDISNAMGALHKVNDEMAVKLSSVEEQCLAMEKANKSVQLDLVTQHHELEKKARELEELNTIIEEEQQKRMLAEVALASLEQIHIHSQEEAELLISEIHCGNEKLKDMELSKVGLEEKISELNEIIGNLHDENKSFNIQINDLQDEMKLLQETKYRLENELLISFEETENLQKELCCLKEDQKDLEESHQGLTEQMKVILERNMLLENSLSDANVELEGLRERANALEASCESLLGEVSNHVVEKGVLASKIVIISQEMGWFTERNTFLENSVSDANAELEGSRVRFKDLEERCMCLCDQNSALLAENSILVSQVDSLGSKYLELQDQHSNLDREKDSTVRQVIELQSSLRIEKHNHEALIMSLTSQQASLQDQIHLLEEEIQFKVNDFEMEQEKVMSSLFEIFILQRCLCDMKDSNLSLFGEYQNLLEASRCMENQISQFKHKELIQKKEIASLLDQKEALSKGIHLLLEELNVDVKDSIGDEVLAQIILGETKNLLLSLSNVRDENQQLHLKVLNLESTHSTLHEHCNSLERDKDSAVHQVMALESFLSLQKQDQEALTLSFLSQLASSQKQVYFLQEEIRARDVDLEMKQQKTINADLENFVLQRCLCDVQDRNLILSVNCQNLLEALRSAENQISQLEHKALIQKKEMASLLVHNEVLSKDIHLLLEELNVDDKDDITDEARLQIILGEVKNLLISIFDARDENQQLYVKVLNLESKCLTLQDHHNYLEREKDSIIHKVTELENFLSLQKQEHEALTLSFSGQLASLRNEIHLLQEGIHVRDVDLETEQQKTINADIEFFVLKRCICEMCDKNLSLSVECQNILEALRCTENQISQLEHKDTMQKRELTLLSNHSEILRAGMHQLLQGLNIDINSRIKDDPTDEIQILLRTIVAEIRDLMSSLSDVNDENQCLRIELLVLNTLFKQTGFDKFHLHHELDRRTEELLALERAKQDLIKMNKQLKGENNFFVSQVENIRHSLELLEAKYSELEEKTLHLEREKYSAFHRVLELECSLKLEKQEHHTLLLSSNIQLASLETQLDLLKKERLVKEDEFEIEQQNTMRALLENFILQRSLHDMRDSNSLLSGECQKLQSACLIQQNEIMLTSENNKNLRSGILLLLKELNINNKCDTVDETKDEALLQTLQHEIETLMNYISNCEVEMQHLHIEMSVLVTLLKHIGLEKCHLYCELASHREELLSVRNCKDLAIQILSEELSDLHVTHQRLQTEMCKLLEENHSLSRRISDLMKKMDALEGENGNVLAEALTVDHLFIFFKSLSVERGLKLKLLSDGILAAKNGLDEEIRVQNNIKKVLEVENMNLMEFAVLQEFDLNVTRNFCEEFHQQLEAEEKSLIQMKLEISDAREENTELYRKLEGLNKDLDCANVITKVLEKEIETLSSDIASKDEKIIEVLETNSLLRIELDILNCEVQAHRRMEDFLSLELRKSSSEACKCEGEIQTLLDDAHISTVNAAILEEKVIGLMVECETHETLSILQRERLGDEIDFKNACIDDMKKELEGLKKQNGLLKAELNAYSSLLISLFDGVACVEEHICSLAQFQETMEDDISRTPSYVKSSHQPSEKEKLPDLQNLIVKIESLQKVMVDTKNLLKQERLDSNAKMESAMKEIEELKQRERLLKEISREKYVQTMKDIQLDQMSNSGSNFSKMNRNENAESDDQMLELWEETSEQNDAIEVEEEVKSECPSCDPGIDKLEVSTRVDESHREWNKRFNEKLDSDAQRLLLIQRSLQELKTRLESSEEKKQPDNREYGTLKMQMREAEEAILQQVDINGKLKKEAEDNFESSNERRQISEQTTEKIGKLELELQKMEYIFLKVQEENEDKKNVCVERKSSILLSEYIYGKKDGRGRRRKSRICGCMRPKTKN